MTTEARTGRGTARPGEGYVAVVRASACLVPGAARDGEASRDTSPAGPISSGHQAGSLPARPSH